MELFSIICTTCHARLKVRDLAAIGQILSCPKCGSMVQVLAPAGWQPPAPAATPDVAPAAPASAAAAAAALPALPRKAPRWSDQADPPGSEQASLAEQAAADASLPNAVPDAAAAATPAPAAASLPTPVVWGKWLLCSGAGLVIVAVGGLLFFSSRPAPDDPVVRPRSAQAIASKPAPRPKHQPPESANSAIPRRWITAGSQAVLSIRPTDAGRKAYPQLLDEVAELSHGALPGSSALSDALKRFYLAFGLRPDEVSRVTACTTQLGPRDAWLEAGLVAVELTGPLESVGRLPQGCQSLDWSSGGPRCYQPPSKIWAYPVVVAGQRTLVTGAAGVLRPVVERTSRQPAIDNPALDHLLSVLNADSDLLLAVDLPALRRAGGRPRWWPLVDTAYDLSGDWKVVFESPLALGLNLHAADLEDTLDTRMHLLCDGKSTAEQLHASLDAALAAAEKSIAAHSDQITQHLLAGQLTTQRAAQFKQLLTAGQAALATRQLGVDQATVWVRTQWHGDLSKLAAAAVASAPVLEATRLAAARPIDEENHRQLLAALAGYETVEQTLPAGAAGAALLPPETRLSWMATLLPYYGHLDWHAELNFGRPWNDPVNARVTRRRLSLVANPALGAAFTEAGFPVTHYVGLAGLGPDAARLPTGDPRAGVFGYQRRLGRHDIADGASNTIATLGVSGRLGSWSAGGDATVRALTARPYINGPDGFGSGQPDGMLAGMADGSVRFLSKDIDPRVLESLATAHGGEHVDLLAGPPTEPLDLSGPLDVPGDESAPVDPTPDELPPATEPEPDGPPEALGRASRQDRRPDDPPADIEARLADRVAAIELDRAALSDVVDLLRQLSTLPITLDLEGLLDAGVGPDDKVSIRMTEATIGQILDAVLQERGLGYVVVEGQLLVTSNYRQQRVFETIPHPIDGLAANQRAAEQLAQLVERLLEPTSWRGVGGEGTIGVREQALEVKQTLAVHRQIEAFLTRLRAARARSPSQPSAASAALQTRFSRARPRLASSVTATFPDETPLRRVVEHFQNVAGVNVLFDGLALAGEGLSPETGVTLSVVEQPLSQALAALTDPLDLAARIVDERTFEITTQRAYKDRLELEFHPVGDLLSSGRTAEALVDRIAGQVAGATWDTAGGPAVLHFDPASSCLLILQTQPVQIRIEALLHDYRAAK
ncbi:MAG: DUF1559 domain-containing protein [Pirellulales bacterium]